MPSMLTGCTPWPEEFADRYGAAGHWRGTTLDDLLRDAAHQHGPRTALVHGAERLTYARLNRRVDRMSAALRMRGLRPGQRAIVQLPGVPELVVTVFALMRAGVIPVLCPLTRRGPEVARLARVTQAVAYVGPSTYQGYDHTAMCAGIAAQRPFLRRVFTWAEPGTSFPYGGLTTDAAGCQYSPLSLLDAAPGPALTLGADQVALFLVSEDDDGVLQLVPRTHNDYGHQVRAAAEAVALTEGDVYLAALPAESALGFGGPGIVGTLSVGGTVVLADSPEPAACLELLVRERVTVTSVTSSTARLWIDQLTLHTDDLSHLRLLQVGGGRVGEAGLPDRAVAERVGPERGCRLQQLLVMPEGPFVLTGPGDPDEAVCTTRGRPLSPGDEIRVAGPDGDDVPAGEPGELLARGPSIVRGYYRAPDHNERRFTPDGYFRTGVLARRTAAGDLVVTPGAPVAPGIRGPEGARPSPGAS
ncbi:AMP-binding protein [Streptomyces sp. NBC_00083]|uniref:AMP-binding protein n=1 Tax=Streptomyces sp. NBC_00083 TaxID=2975647 RepID=UPI002259BF2A|nr:AMP-binding protein [Streptomyces sp. NBC_00083]MCX5386937.1 AMP-binding protein [Streptomyces sp. NBC_00083]